MSLFIVVTLVVFGMTYQRPIQWLLLTASLLATWASFQQKDRIIRLVFMLTTTLWLLHNIWIVTYGGILLEVLFLVSNVIGYRKFYSADSYSENSHEKKVV